MFEKMHYRHLMSILIVELFAAHVRNHMLHCLQSLQRGASPVVIHVQAGLGRAGAQHAHELQSNRSQRGGPSQHLQSGQAHQVSAWWAGAAL